MHGVEHTGGDDHLLPLEVAQFAGGDQGCVGLDVEFRAVHLVGFYQLQLALAVAPEADQQTGEATIVGHRGQVARRFATSLGSTVPDGLERLHIELQLVAVDGTGVAGEAVHLVGVEVDVLAREGSHSAVVLSIGELRIES